MFRVRSAVASLLRRMPSLRSVIGPLQKLIVLDPRVRHALERKALVRRQIREKQEMERRKRALASVEKRERESLEDALHRNRRLAGRPGRSIRQAFARAARDHFIRAGEGAGDTELLVLFNDAADFVEGPPASDDGAEDHDYPPRVEHDDDPAHALRRRRRRRKTPVPEDK